MEYFAGWGDPITMTRNWSDGEWLVNARERVGEPEVAVISVQFFVPRDLQPFKHMPAPPVERSSRELQVARHFNQQRNIIDGFVQEELRLPSSRRWLSRPPRSCRLQGRRFALRKMPWPRLRSCRAPRKWGRPSAQPTAVGLATPRVSPVSGFARGRPSAGRRRRLTFPSRRTWGAPWRPRSPPRIWAGQAAPRRVRRQLASLPR
jgi:hypothetical protein